MICGLDLSLRSTGVSLRWKDGKEEIFCVTTDEKQFANPYERYTHITQEVCNRLHKGWIVLIEDYVSHARGSAISRMELGGLLKTTIYFVTGVVPIEVAPTTLKKFMTGSGTGKKNLVLKEALKLWGRDFDSDDKADAWGLSQIGVFAAGWDDTRVTKSRQEVLKAVRKQNPNFWPDWFQLR